MPQDSKSRAQDRPIGNLLYISVYILRSVIGNIGLRQPRLTWFRCQRYSRQVSDHAITQADCLAGQSGASLGHHAGASRGLRTRRTLIVVHRWGLSGACLGPCWGLSEAE